MPSGKALQPSDVNGFIFSAFTVLLNMTSKTMELKRIIFIRKSVLVKLYMILSVTVLVTNNNTLKSIKRFLLFIDRLCLYDNFDLELCV